MPTTPSSDPIALALATIDDLAGELTELRRDLHAHPEVAWTEARSTDIVATRLREAGWRVTQTEPTGLFADLGEAGPVLAARADLDALPVDDRSGLPWASTNPGIAHACGHDVHTAGVVGAGLAVAAVHQAGLLNHRVRLLFQPAEEVMPGGATSMMEQGALADVDQIFCLHCDPTIDIGQVGLREGPITGAADQLEVTFSGSGGHTSRPHLTEDLTFAMAKVVTELPAALTRRVDPRAGVTLVWGRVNAGVAANVIPESGSIAGTVRMLDIVAWDTAEHLIRSLIDDIVAPYGVKVEVDYRRGVPPVVNETGALAHLAGAVERVLGPTGRTGTPQSLGGEDFAWYLKSARGAMGRLGTRTPGGPTYDLHQGNLVVDEQAPILAAKVLATAVLTD